MNDVGINDLAKYLAVNFTNQRDQDTFIIDNAHYFRCAYTTYRADHKSDKFTTLSDARAAAKFARG